MRSICLPFARRLFLLVCAGSFPLTAALKAQTTDGIRLIIELSDSSRLVGAPTNLSTLEFLHPAVGKVQLPLTKLRRLEFENNSSTVLARLTNQDTLRGQISQSELALATLVGHVTVPMQNIVRVQVAGIGNHARLLAAEDWDPVPFPVTCDWPGPKGQPSLAKPEAIELRGYPIRTREPVRFPLTWECEVECTEQGQGREGTDLNFYFFAPGVPRNEEPSTAIHLSLRARGGAGGMSLQPVLCQSINDKRNSREIWHGPAQPFEFGKTYKVLVQFEPDQVRIQVGDQEGTAENLTIDLTEAQIQLWNWQPTSRWRVRGFPMCTNRFACGLTGL